LPRGFIAKHVKIIINDAFWYLGGRTGGRLCSYRKVGNMPKYQIMSDRFGGAVLDIFPDDHKADTENVFFGPTEDKDAITQAMEHAEKYEAEHYQS
jgi:hypothetical protein